MATEDGVVKERKKESTQLPERLTIVVVVQPRFLKIWELSTTTTNMQEEDTDDF
jgi:hypothetical protein